MISSNILSEIISDQCMNLCTRVLSQYDFIDLAHPIQEYWCPFENFKLRFDDIFAKEFIELAALVRVILDVDDSFGSKEVVGTITQDGNKIDMSFRDACNKIIHAKTIDIDFAFSERHPLDNGKNGYGESQVKKFKNPFVRTTGEFQKKSWKSNIDFLKFIEVAKAKLT